MSIFLETLAITTTTTTTAAAITTTAAAAAITTAAAIDYLVLFHSCRLRALRTTNATVLDHDSLFML